MYLIIIRMSNEKEQFVSTKQMGIKKGIQLSDVSKKATSKEGGGG